MFLQLITESGNLFQTVSAGQEKPLDAVTVLVRGTVSNRFDEYIQTRFEETG